MGIRHLAGLVRSLREEVHFPVFLSADDTRSLPRAVAAAKAGYDAIVFDLSTLPRRDPAEQ